MPRAGPKLGRAFYKGIPQEVLGREDKLPKDAEARIIGEWAARCGPDQLVGMAVEWQNQQGYGSDAHASKDPGPLMEYMWRANLRIIGPSGYQHAERLCGFADKALPGTSDVRHAARQGLEDVSGDKERRKHFEEIMGIAPDKLSKVITQFVDTATLRRPHGFSSVGRVAADTPLGQLLQHGLQVFLATAFDPDAVRSLHARHLSYVSINLPHVEMLRYGMCFSSGRDVNTFSGTVPPVGAQVPLFDHLSLSWQLYFVRCVISGTLQYGKDAAAEDDVPQQEIELPQDTPYHWAAFNKLLLLGMYAPVEEARATDVSLGVVKQQQQQLAAVREAEADAALNNMQQALTELRVALHEQLSAELAVGHAALQLFAQQQQQQPDALRQLQQQLQSCELSDLWTQHGRDGSKQVHQQLLLLVAWLLAWPLSYLAHTFSQQGAEVLLYGFQALYGQQPPPLQQQPLLPQQPPLPQQPQQQQQQPQQPQQQPQPSPLQQQQGASSVGQPGLWQGTEYCLQQLQQLLDAVVTGLGAAQHNKAGNSLADGMRGMWRLLQQQTSSSSSNEQQQAAEGQDAEGVLVAWLVQLLAPFLSSQAAATSTHISSSSDAGRSSSSSSSLRQSCLSTPEAGAEAGAGAAQPDSPHAASATDEGTQQGPSCDPVAGVQLQAFARGVCHVLLMRLLAAAPPCELWSWDACVAVLQLLVAVEHLTSAASQLVYVAFAEACTEAEAAPLQAQWQQEVVKQAAQPGEQSSEACCQQQQQPGPAANAQLPAGFYHLQQSHAKLRSSLLGLTQRLLDVLHALQLADDALQHCSSSCNGSGQQSHEGSSNKHSSSNTQRSNKGDVLQQQQQSTWWRQQTLQLYQKTRPSGYSWLQSCFKDVSPDNCSPGFWALVGRFAFADQLNLQHQQDPTALAAAPAVVPLLGLEETHHLDKLIPQAVISKHLARVANRLLHTQYTPINAMWNRDDAVPVQSKGLIGLMETACQAAMQPPLLLPYASPVVQQHSQAERRGAAAVGAAGAAAEAVKVWKEYPGLHLSPALAMGPLFAQEQQRPCLVRLLQLLLQYRQDTAAAGGRLTQQLLQQLDQLGVHVPNAGSGSSRTARSSFYSSNSSSSSSVAHVPPERSRLLVLLMGLYHLLMLEEQQQQQQLQHYNNQQQQRLREWAAQRKEQHQMFRQDSQGPDPQQTQQQPGQRQQQQPQQQQAHSQHKRQQLRLSRTESGGPAVSTPAASSGPDAPAAAGSCFGDLAVQLSVARTAADVAYTMQDLLLYCLLPAEAAAAAPPSGRSTSSSSSSSRWYQQQQQQQPQQQQQQQQSSDQQRFQICTITKALVAEHFRLVEEFSVEPSTPPAAGCDVCSTRTGLHATAVGLALGEAFPPPPSLSRSQGDEPSLASCGKCHLLMCQHCSNDRQVITQHTRVCGSGGLQAAHVAVVSAVRAFSDADPAPTADAVAQLDPCTCSVCQTVQLTADMRLALRWWCSPLAQLSSPPPPLMQQQQQQQRLPPGLQLPQRQPKSPHAAEQQQQLRMLELPHFMQEAADHAVSAPHTLGSFDSELRGLHSSLLQAQLLLDLEHGKGQQAGAGSSSTSSSSSKPAGQRGSGKTQQQQQQQSWGSQAPNTGTNPWHAAAQAAAAAQAMAASMREAAAGMQGTGRRAGGPAAAAGKQGKTASAGRAGSSWLGRQRSPAGPDAEPSGNLLEKLMQDLKLEDVALDDLVASHIDELDSRFDDLD